MVDQGEGDSWPLGGGNSIMLFKVWLAGGEFDFSIIFEAKNIEGAIAVARSYATKYNAKVKTVDNVHTGSLVKREGGTKHGF